MHQLNSTKNTNLTVKSQSNQFETENIIMGGGRLMEGDFNFYMDPARDKQNNMNSRDNNPIYKPEIIALQVRLHLTDAWRVQNPNTFA